MEHIYRTWGPAVLLGSSGTCGGGGGAAQNRGRKPGTVEAELRLVPRLVVEIFAQKQKLILRVDGASEGDLII